MRRVRLEKLEDAIGKLHPEKHDFKIDILGGGVTRYYVDGLEVSKENFYKYDHTNETYDVRLVDDRESQAY